MPRVPQAEQQQQIGGLPNARITAAPTAETFGSGIAQVGEQVGLALYTRAVREEDEQAFLAADLELAKKQTELQLSVQELKGKAALAGPDLIEKEWKTTTDAVMKGLSSDRQRRNTEAQSRNRFMRLSESAQIHSFNEHEVLKDKNFEAYIQTTTDQAQLLAGQPLSFEKNAKTNTSAIEDQFLLQAESIDNFGVRKGLTTRLPDGSMEKTDAFTAMQATILSNTHAQVVKGMELNGKDRQAAQYYKDHEKDFVAKDRDSVGAHVQEGSYRGESRRALAQYQRDGLDEGEMLEKAKAIPDPKLADMVVERVRHDWQVQKQRIKEEIDAAFEEDSKSIEAAPKGRALDDIVPSFLSYGTSYREAFKKQWEDHQKPMPRVTDYAVYNEFNQLPYAKIAALSQTDLKVNYLQHMDEGDVRDTQHKWRTLKEGLAKADAKVTHMQTFDQMVGDAWLRSNLISDSDSKDAKKENHRLEAELRRKSGERITTLSQEKGRPLNENEVREQVETVMQEQRKKLFVDRGAFQFSKETTVLGLKEDERGAAYVPWSEIPEPDRIRWTSIITKMNKKASKSKIERVYGQVRQGNTEAAFVIASE